MRRLARIPLAQSAIDQLSTLQARVDDAEDSAAAAKSLWRSDRPELRPVHEALREMASGRTRCMYCEDNTGVDIEHFWPKSRFPARTFDWMNYLLACPQCNSNYKRAKFPRTVATGEPLLVDPTVDDPSDHVVLTLREGLFEPMSAKGVFSVDVFHLNRPDLRIGRRDAWTKLRELVPRYAALRRAGDDDRADLLAAALRNESFSRVRLALIEIADSHAAHLILPEDVREALDACPEIRDW